MATTENHGMKFMLTQSYKISGKHKTVNKIKDLLFEHQRELNDLYKHHRLLMNFAKHLQVQDLPSVDGFHKEFLHQVEIYNKRRMLYMWFPKFGQKYLQESILFWLLDSCDGVYVVYKNTNLHIDESYRTEIKEAVYILYSKITDISLQKNKLSTAEFIELIKADTLRVLSNLSKLQIKISHDKSTIEKILYKINEKRQAL